MPPGKDPFWETKTSCFSENFDISHIFYFFTSKRLLVVSKQKKKTSINYYQFCRMNPKCKASSKEYYNQGLRNRNLLRPTKLPRREKCDQIFRMPIGDFLIIPPNS